MFGLTVSAVLALSLQAQAQTYSATYLPSTAPDHTEPGQTGTNACGTGSSQNSSCQNSYLNSVEDFCLFAPPEPGPGSVIGNTEQIEIAWCMKSGYGTRLIPDGTMKGAHFVQTPDYVQITGIGDLTKINVPAGDAGGELDPHGATGNGNPIGGLVFSSAFGQLEQIHEWTNFMSDSQFCFRACRPGPNAPGNCQHIYDVMGCEWNMPANYAAGTFENCQGDSAQPMGVYGGSTFHQGDPSTPPAHPIPSSSLCTTLSTISNGVVASGPSSSSGSSSSTLSSSSSSSFSSILSAFHSLGPSATTPHSSSSSTSKPPGPSSASGGSSSSGAANLVFSTSSFVGAVLAAIVLSMI